MTPIGNDWDVILRDAFQSEAFLQLSTFLDHAYATQTVYPPRDRIFTALRLTPYSSVKVVILGQDPYHEPNQAHGLAFSVPHGTPLPASLRNIYKELESDLNIPFTSCGSLEGWAKQGVLLLNSVLTVEHGRANAHKGRGWELLTDEIITKLSQRSKPLVFMLWGRHAQAKIPLITGAQHHILQAPHPSPLSAHRGFLGCRHFSQANTLLAQWGETVDWSRREA